MLVMTVFASSAMAITVDGEISPSDEWDVYDEMVTDDIGDTCSTGYDITSLRMRVEGDTLYILMVLDGVPGDADNDGNPDTYTNSDPATCGCVNPSWTDYEGVGVGMPCPREQYGVEIDSNNNGGLDYTLMYCSGGPSLYDEDDFKILGAHTGAAHGTIVELSVDIDEYCDINPANYCVYGFADTQCNGNEDAIDQMCHFDAPPTAVCSFTPISCGQGTLSGTGSSDDGTIVEYAWDFYNDGTYDAFGNRGKIIGAWCRIDMEGQAPLLTLAKWEDFNKNNPIWKQYGSSMIIKCAENIGLKKISGKNSAGLVSSAEIIDKKYPQEIQDIDLEEGQVIETEAKIVE